MYKKEELETLKITFCNKQVLQTLVKKKDLTENTEEDADVEEKGNNFVTYEQIGADPLSSFAAQLENVYLTQRLDMIREDQVSTPLAVLREMTDVFKEPLNTESFHLYLPETREIFWRIELTVGKMKGFGESPVRKLASHMAAADILQQIISRKNVEVPVYGLLPGCRISPKIFNMLLDVCSENELGQPEYYMDEIEAAKTLEDGPPHVVHCRVEDLVFSAASDSLYLAKRVVCLKMYEAITGEVFPPYKTTYGDQCTPQSVMEGLKLTPVSTFVTEEFLADAKLKGIFHENLEYSGGPKKTVDIGSKRAGGLKEDVLDK